MIRCLPGYFQTINLYILLLSYFQYFICNLIFFVKGKAIKTDLWLAHIFVSDQNIKALNIQTTTTI